MSSASSDLLKRRYSHNPAARVVFDPAGGAPSSMGEQFDLVVCASVLHHIPDYLGAIRDLAEVTALGGAFASFQDPLWYPRRTRRALAGDKAAYYFWRVRRGDVGAGISTRVRRIRGEYDESNWRDMVEYHVVRQGCDEAAIASILAEYFSTVVMTPYWSTQSRLMQSIGEWCGAKSTFAALARGRTA